jgi:hypothetical protein
MVRYELVVRQEPKRARMSGFRIRDRRPIDPVPIVECIMYDDNDQRSDDFTRAPYLILHVVLLGKDKTEYSSVADSHYSQVLLGQLVSPGHILSDLDGQKGLFFMFSDLSIRTSGQYRLKFVLFDVGNLKGNSASQAVAASEPFMVYSPKTFPGVTESSDLLKCFARQGLQIHIRDGRSNGGGSSSSNGSINGGNQLQRLRSVDTEIQIPA